MAERKDDLPAEAIPALWQGNKIEAIKILRQAHHHDLEETSKPSALALRSCGATHLAASAKLEGDEAGRSPAQ